MGCGAQPLDAPPELPEETIMKPAPFEYVAPDSLEQAVSLTAQHGADAKLLAGGQSLIPAMNFRVVQPAMLIDLNRIPELRYIRPGDDGSLMIGAMTTQHELETDGLVSERAPLLCEALPHIAHPQIRNRGTIGGSLVHADPAAELPVIALACGARLKAQSPKGERWIEVGDFFQGMFVTDLSEEEILTEIVLPPSPAGSGWSFMEASRRRGDYAMMGLAALVGLDDNGLCDYARLVYLNAGDGPVDATEAADSLVGRMPEAIAYDEAAAIASEKEIEPFGNVHASVDFQRHLARVLTRRALAQAFARASKM
jgi:carbon-monoxide dehydrogenase medium subunit